jgi:ribonuclease E
VDPAADIGETPYPVPFSSAETDQGSDERQLAASTEAKESSGVAAIPGVSESAAETQPAPSVEEQANGVLQQSSDRASSKQKSDEPQTAEVATVEEEPSSQPLAGEAPAEALAEAFTEDMPKPRRRTRAHNDPREKRKQGQPDTHSK